MTDTAVTIYNKQEIQQKIEELTQPGSSVFFYVSGSPSSGGPLGRGAAIVELNPAYPGKKQKKYIVYCADVEGTQPTSNKTKIFDSDKPKEVVGWVSERHCIPRK